MCILPIISHFICKSDKFEEIPVVIAAYMQRLYVMIFSNVFFGSQKMH